MAQPRVPVIGRGDQHRVDLLRLQQLAMIVEAFGRSGLLLHFVDLRAVDIADGVDVHCLLFWKRS